MLKILPFKVTKHLKRRVSTVCLHYDLSLLHSANRLNDYSVFVVECVVHRYFGEVMF